MDLPATAPPRYELIEVEGGVPIKAWVRGVPFDERAREQLQNVARLPFVHRWVAAMPDVHWGIGEAERVWFLLHSGSRGVGNRIGTYFIELAKRDMQARLGPADAQGGRARRGGGPRATSFAARAIPRASTPAPTAPAAP